MNTPNDLVCQAISTLPAESRDSFYIEQRAERQRFFCRLCQVEASLGALSYHFEDANHQAKVALLKEDLERSKELSTRFNRLFSKDSFLAKRVERSNEISDLQSRIHIDSLLFDYLVANATENEENEKFLLDQALGRLDWSEQLERCMLLGLAVWKAECLWKMPKDSSVHDATVWIESGWKKCKGEQLSSNAIPVIVRAVGPFLGYPTLADIFDDRKTRRSRTFYLHNL